jgi:AcrR family transcriptional regulator
MSIADAKQPRTTHTSRRPTRDHTRERILAAAAAVIARLGYDGASLDDIAREAQLTKGAIYSSFANKQALLLSLIERCVDHDVATLETLRTSDLTAFDEHLDRLLTPFHGTEQDRLLRLEFWLCAARNARVREVLDTQFLRLRAATVHVLTDLTDSGRLRPSALTHDQLASLLLALALGSSALQIVSPTTLPERALATLLHTAQHTKRQEGGA